MADQLQDPPPGEGPARDAHAGMPRWVKVFGGIALVLVVLVVILLLTGGGNHGPGRHTGSGDTPPANVRDAGGHQPPAGGHTP